MKGMSMGVKSTAAGRKPPARDDFNAADARFMQDMLAHHEMAIAMSENIIKDGKNSSVLKLARSIKSAQLDEILLMRKWLYSRDLPEDSSKVKM
jgi:uncharacterized protein (DUF305 family)